MPLGYLYSGTQAIVRRSRNARNIADDQVERHRGVGYVSLPRLASEQDGHVQPGNRTGHLRIAVILPCSVWLQFAVGQGGATVVCRSNQVNTSGPSTKVWWMTMSVRICPMPVRP